MSFKDWILLAGMLVACGCRATHPSYCAMEFCTPSPTRPARAAPGDYACQQITDCKVCDEPSANGALEPTPDHSIRVAPVSVALHEDSGSVQPVVTVAAMEPEEIGYLRLREVIESVYASFPALEAARSEAEIAAGKETSALGEFDFKVKAESMSAPMGYYKNYRNQLKLEQGLFPGGNVFGQYRSGDGNFPVPRNKRD